MKEISRTSDFWSELSVGLYIGFAHGLNHAVCDILYWVSFLYFLFLVHPIIHCNENPIYLFLFWEKDYSFHGLVTVGDLYIPRIGPGINGVANFI